MRRAEAQSNAPQNHLDRSYGDQGEAQNENPPRDSALPHLRSSLGHLPLTMQGVTTTQMYLRPAEPDIHSALDRISSDVSLDNGDCIQPPMQVEVTGVEIDSSALCIDCWLTF